MRGRIFASFLVGMAAGAACLAIVLYAAGALRLSAVQTSQTALTAPAVEQSPVPDTSNVKLPQQPLNLPPVQAPQPASGEASREVPPPPQVTHRPEAGQGPPAAITQTDDWQALSARHLAMPVAGADPTKLVDTFKEGRTGHVHEAIDIMAPHGTPVVAVDEGNIVKLFNSKQGGLTVYQFDNSQTYCYYYAHLDRYAEGLKEGMLVRRGDKIGYVGSTGDADASAPHLHFTIFKLGPEKQWWKGTPIDPFPLLTGK